MSELDYTFAVARVRVLEKSLLTDADIAQMTALSDEPAVLQFLAGKGWGESGAAHQTAEDMLACETEKTKQTVRELLAEPELLQIFSYQDMYHNLKAAIKVTCTQGEAPGVFVSCPGFDRERMLQIVGEKAWRDLPAHMQEAAAEAYQTLLQTRDGQRCDIILDRAALEAIAKAGKESDEPVIRDYADRLVSVADIRIAVRAAGVGKNREFLTKALAPCPSLDAAGLARAAAAGKESVIAWLRTTRFAPAADALAQSPSAFERWCDDEMTEAIRPQKRNPFSAGPVIAYMLARQNEIRMARILLTAKANGLPETAIRERTRRMYG